MRPTTLCGPSSAAAASLPGATPDLVREKLLSRARNAIARASSLVAQAERVAEPGGVEEGDESAGG